VEALEARRLLCGLPHELLGSAPAFDWTIEQREAERLESRGGPEATSIVWSNRGHPSDGFDLNFGASAAAGRAVVDAVFDLWEGIITDWNRSDGTTTLQINLAIANSNGFGGGAHPDPIVPNDGKPRTGVISLGRGNNSSNPNDSNGWFFDPTPFDNSEFLGNIVNAYAGTDSAGVGSDMFSVISAELAHVMGLISDMHNLGGFYQGYQVENWSTNTGIADNAEGGGVGTFYVFDGPTIDHLMTSFDSGAGSWGNVVHTAGGTGNINFAGRNWIGSEDGGNAIGASNERTLPSYVVANILKDAYGYTVNNGKLNTFYTVLDETTNVLTIRGGAGASADVINIGRIDANRFQVEVDIGNDVPGTGPFPGAGNLGAFIAEFNIADVSTILVQPGDGADALNVFSLPAGVGLTAQMGAGADQVVVGFGLGNFDSQILSNINLTGGAGTDTLQITDVNDVGNDTYQFFNGRFSKTSVTPFVSYSDIESIDLTCNGFNNTVHVDQLLAPTTNLLVNGMGGDDTINVGGGNFASNLPPLTTVTFVGGSGSDRANLNDGISSGPGTYTMTTGRISKSFTGSAVVYSETEHAALSASSAGDTIYLTNALAPLETVTMDAGGGDDHVLVGDGDVENDIFAGVSLSGGSSGMDELHLIDVTAPAGRIWHFNLMSCFTGSGSPINYDAAVEKITLNGGNEADSVRIWNLGPQAALQVNGNGGNDTFNLGPDFVVADILGRVTLSGDAGSDTIGAVDRNNTNGTPISNVIDPTTLAIAGMPHAIDYSGVEQFFFIGHDGHSTTHVRALPPEMTTVGIEGFGGNDDVRLGAPVLAALGNVTITVQDSGTAFTDRLFVDDTGGAINNTWTITNTTIDRTNFGLLNYAGFEQLSVIGGTARDEFNLSTASGSIPMTIEGGASEDTFNVDLTGHGAAGSGSVSLVGGADTDRVLVRDDNPAVELRRINASFFDRLSAPAHAYATIESLTWNGGAATEFFAVESTSSQCPVVINGGDGDETVLVGGFFVPQNLDGVQGPLTFNGQGGSDYMALMDQLSGSAHQYTVTDATIDRSGAARVTYGTLESLRIGPGNQADTIDVIATAPGVPLNIDPSTGGGDIVNVNLDGFGAAHVVFVFSNSVTLGALSIGNGGGALVLPNGSRVLRTGGLDIAPGGRLDLTDNAMIVDYAPGGPSPLPAIAARLTSGYNGGAWNGFGIMSSSASGTPQRALGYAESSALFSTFPATFAGQQVDDSAVLVRYTRYGDANLDQTVNLADFNRLASNFASGTLWSQGNFNFDATVNLGDFNALASNFGQSAAPSDEEFVGAHIE
jgi:hypothetical protein